MAEADFYSIDRVVFVRGLCYFDSAMEKLVSDHDTIVAVATPPGRGPISIIRISGPRALPLAESLFQGDRKPRDLPGFSAAHGWIELKGERLDEVLCLVMRGPRSYTREDVVEFHCHGGPVPVQRVLEAVVKAGARPAHPGEFTKRAFLAGRIDLAQAEAVADLIASETEAAARAAAAQLQGGLSNELQDRRRNLALLLARLEAGIDFADEEDVVAIEPGELEQLLKKAEDEVARLLDQAEQGRRYREGARVAIAGRPNVGKSTLMNTLLRSDRVIVTPLPGTTRDVVEDAIEVSGIPVRLFDTAGLRQEANAVERIGVDRARAAIESADLALLLIDGSEPISEDDERTAAMTGTRIMVVNKCDLEVKVDKERVGELARGAPMVFISALTGEGIEGLERAVARELIGDAAAAEPPLVTNLRHARALEKAGDAIRRAQKAHERGLSHEFVASDLRLALEALGEITGETATHEILDIIFSRFCIGK